MGGTDGTGSPGGRGPPCRCVDHLYQPPKKPNDAGVKISAGSELIPRDVLDFKERVEVPGDGFGELIEGHVCQAGEEGGGLDDESGLVAPAPMGNGGEIGRVGFDEEPVRGDPRRDPAEVPGFGERRDSGKGDEETGVEHGLGELPILGETMEDAAVREPLLPNRLSDLRPRGPAVDDGRQTQSLGKGELFPEGFPLFVGRGKIIMKIEPDLADRPDLFIGRQLLGGSQKRRGKKLGLMGMQAGRGVESQTFGSQARRDRQAAFARNVDGAEEGPNPRLERSAEDVVRSASNSSISRWAWESISLKGYIYKIQRTYHTPIYELFYEFGMCT